jgi:hypothetical protein
MTKTILKGSIIAALSIMMLLSALPPASANGPTTVGECIVLINNLQTETNSKVNDRDAGRLFDKLETAKGKLNVEPSPKIDDAIKKINNYISKISNLPDKKFKDAENALSDKQHLIGLAEGVLNCINNIP